VSGFSLRRLRETAEAATPAEGKTVTAWVRDSFEAAFDPPTVLQLLAIAEAADREHTGWCPDSDCGVCEALAALRDTE